MANDYNPSSLAKPSKIPNNSYAISGNPRGSVNRTGKIKTIDPNVNKFGDHRSPYDIGSRR